MSTTTRMTKQQRYARDGFVIHDQSVLPSELLARATQALTDVRSGEYATGVAPVLDPLGNVKDDDSTSALYKIEMPQFASGDLLEAIRATGLGEIAAEITGAEWVQAWWVQGLYKSATVGQTDETNIGWHQDLAYWAPDWKEGSELFTAWLALSDVRPESGPMRFVPGSHRWGLVGGDFFAQDLDSLKAGLNLPAGAEWSEVADELPGGGVSFHNCQTLHGSSQNVSMEPRISMAIHLRTEKSAPVPNGSALTSYLDDPAACPVIFGDR
jgi:hypothetical protein